MKKKKLKPFKNMEEYGKALGLEGPSEDCSAAACSRFSFVDVTTAGSEGTLNLMFDDYPVAWVNNLHVAQQIREYLSENREDRGPA